ncbi:ethanolamine ammonia-lyase subunit EutC [Cytobacillus sp. FSL W8-0315]|uniref:ethanolamine ammonia-lyase subunit EutC n=1 Tax=Cytobacillus TaxID=2675230 RepID=UPI0020425461|nr:ethanolamine ammonia-lyase subunit EutC [Cytobacillus oceanisediminis]MCM3244212.1 ethanolamine ammonia-lyase subunit EutC [Cytobacillus oceanisediminis]MCS0825969.1 ethanolamine ammonia-lyase subunit EutC [Cytobacillus firmus]
MNPELIEKVTRLVVEKLQSQQTSDVKGQESSAGVKFWQHTSNPSTQPSKMAVEVIKAGKEDTDSLIKIKSYQNTNALKMTSTVKASHDKNENYSKKAGIDHPTDPVELEALKSKTPARIGVGRAGTRPKTDTWLKFRFDHAAAVDAVYGDVNDELINSLGLFKVNTMVNEKEVYIRRPDYGRKLSEEAKKIILAKCQKGPAVQIILSDGLSSSAIEENAEDVYLSLQQSLKSLGLDMGTPFYIEKGRVAVMDEVGELLKPKVVVLLIGERPGLVSAESLSAYLCYEPRKGTIEADRMVISNIHKGGIPPAEAGAYLGTVIQKVLKYEASGVSLVKKQG